MSVEYELADRLVIYPMHEFTMHGLKKDDLIAMSFEPGALEPAGIVTKVMDFECTESIYIPADA